MRTEFHAWPRNYLLSIAARREKVGFPQENDNWRINHIAGQDSCSGVIGQHK